jgi:DNA-directed RNA polymerase subunit alpha
MPIGVIAMDSIFTPIKNVTFRVENTRVRGRTDYEKLILDITTDGTITPKYALTEAASILIEHFKLFSDVPIQIRRQVIEPQPQKEKEKDEEWYRIRQLLKIPLSELEISVRAYNCLKAADIQTVGDLVQYSVADLLKFRNFGKKSLSELEKIITDMGLSFGMDVSEYRLDEDE